MTEHPNDQLTALESQIANLNRLDDVCAEDEHEFLDRVFGKIPKLNGPELVLPFEWDGKYRLVRYLGGGMSDVYLAEQISLSGRQVVVKILPVDAMTDASKIKLFRQESETLAKATTASIVFPIDYAVFDGHPYLVMEHVPGKTLTERMSESPLTVADVADIVGSSACALHAAHSVKIIHGDVKPSNMILQDDGSVKLIDFGLSSFFQKTDRSRFGGTLPYAAPEQLSGEEVDARTDLYCLGVVLRNLLEVAKSTNNIATGRKQAHQAEQLNQLANQLTAFSKEQRPSNADDVAVRLRRITNGESSSQRWRLVGIAVAVTVLCAFSAVCACWPTTDTQQTSVQDPSPASSRIASAKSSNNPVSPTLSAAVGNAAIPANSNVLAGEQPIPSSAGTVIGISPSGKFIVSKNAASDRHQIIELKAGKVIGSFDALSGLGLDWDADEKKIMVAGRNGQLMHLTIVNGKGDLLQRWSTTFSPFAEMSPNGDRILLQGGKLRMKDLAGKTIKSFVAPEQSFRGWGNRLHTSSWSDDGTKFAFYDEVASTVLVYAKDGGQPIKTIAVNRPGYIGFRWLRSGNEFVSLHHIYDLDGKRRRLSTTEGIDRSFNPDETQWVASDGTVGLATGRTLSLKSSFENGFTFWNQPEVITSVNAARPGHFREYTPDGELIRDVTPEKTTP